MLGNRKRLLFDVRDLNVVRRETVLSTTEPQKMRFLSNNIHYIPTIITHRMSGHEDSCPGDIEFHCRTEKFRKKCC